ncbi:MAG: YggS family pyridoxal phosphate-dependent enzyme, partial [Syntrophothermus sp.]
MISEALNIIQGNIARACQTSGREVSAVKIIAVSKNTGLELITGAFNAGLTDFGENKAQELAEKAALLDKSIRWHFLGHLQRNKVKQVVPIAEYIHSVDSVRLAEEINIQAGRISKIQKILLEVKTSDEESKYGISNPEELLKLAEACSRFPNIELTGLMTMAPYTEDEKIIRKSFSDLRKLKATLYGKGYP